LRTTRFAKDSASIPSKGNPNVEDTYFVHDGYDGWSYGSPANPLPITRASAVELMKITGLTPAAARTWLPPAQYADVGDALYEATHGNRFLAYGDVTRCSMLGGYRIGAPIDLVQGLEGHNERSRHGGPSDG
jgi:hypothetical protein